MFRLFIINDGTNEEQGVPGTCGTASDARRKALDLLSPLDAASRVSGIVFRVEIRRTEDGALFWSETSCLN